MKNLIKITSLGLIAAAMVALPMALTAQDATTNSMDSAASTNAAPVMKKKKGGVLPFHGAIVSLDASAGTLTVGELNLTITSTTKIATNGVPATLADFKIGDKVTGAYKKTADGTLNVTTLRLGGGKKKAPPTAAASTSASAATSTSQK